MAKILMLQGTMSNVGKTFLTAGLCRLFAKKGYRTAPFKAQNLSSGSFLISGGKEIGIGQAVQARACGIAPQSGMNPLLLKWENGKLAAFLHGERLPKEKSDWYFSHREELMEEILADYEELSRQYDVIMIEGAGCAAEPNLMERDIANMGFARRVQAPVLLVGDIRRGGVFASLYGAFALLPPEDRALIKGFLINKFDGERVYLDPAPAILEERTGVPVLGVLPTLPVQLEEEDVSFSPLENISSVSEQEAFDAIADMLGREIHFDTLAELMKMGQLA